MFRAPKSRTSEDGEKNRCLWPGRVALRDKKPKQAEIEKR